MPSAQDSIQQFYPLPLEGQTFVLTHLPIEALLVLKDEEDDWEEI